MAGDSQSPRDPNNEPPVEPPSESETPIEPPAASPPPDDEAARRQALLNRRAEQHGPAVEPAGEPPAPAVEPAGEPPAPDGEQANAEAARRRALLDRRGALVEAVQEGNVPIPTQIPIADAPAAAPAGRPARPETAPQAQPAAPAGAAAAQLRAEQAETQAERYARITEEINRRPSVRVTPEQDVVAVTIGEDEEFTLPYPEALSQQERRQFVERIQTIIESIEFDFKIGKSPSINLRFRRRADRELRDVSGENPIPGDYSTLLGLLKRTGNTNALPQETPTEAQERSAHIERNALIAERLERLLKKAIELNPTGTQRRQQQVAGAEKRTELAQVLAVNFSFRAKGEELEQTVEGATKKIALSEDLQKDKTRRAAALRELQAFSTPGRAGFFLDAAKSEVDVIGVGAAGGPVSIATQTSFLELHTQLAELRKKGTPIPAEQQVRYLDKRNRMLEYVVEQIIQKALADFESRTAPTPEVAQAQARAETTAGKFDARITQRISAAKREARGIEIVRNLPVVKQIADFFTGYRRHAKWTTAVSLGALGASLGITAAGVLFPGFAAAGVIGGAIEGFRRFIAGPVTFLSLFDLMQRGAEKKQRGAKGLLRTMTPDEIAALTREQVFEHMAAIEIDRKIKNVDIEKWLSKNFKAQMGDEYETTLGTTYHGLQDRLKSFAQETYQQEEVSIKAQALSPEQEKLRLERALNGSLDRMIKEVSDRKDGKAFQQVGGVVARLLTAAAGGWFVGSGRFAHAIGGAVHAATHGQETLHSLAKFFHLDTLFGAKPAPPASPLQNPEAGLTRSGLPGRTPGLSAGQGGDTLVSTPGGNAAGGLSPDQAQGGPRRLIDGPGIAAPETLTEVKPDASQPSGAPTATSAEGLGLSHAAEILKSHPLLGQHGYSFYEVPGHPDWIQTKITSSPDLYRTLRRVVMDASSVGGHFNAVDAGKIENSVSNLYQLLHKHDVAGFHPSKIDSFVQLHGDHLTIKKYADLSSFIDHDLMKHAGSAVKDAHAQAVHYAVQPGEHWWQKVIDAKLGGPASEHGIHVNFSDAPPGSAPAGASPIKPGAVPVVDVGTGASPDRKGGATLFAPGIERVTDWHNQLVTQWGIEPVKIRVNLDSVVLSIEQAIREGKGATSAALSYLNELAAKNSIQYTNLKDGVISKALSEKGAHLHDNIRALLDAFSTPTGKEFNLFYDNGTHRMTPIINNPVSTKTAA